ncbi:YceI family protein [Adhaeribacter rhizoryzae]|uniref:YceI family protein n=1 Tax=Adhaeribacter rhizoryzae TaxID=2607907 RepID=A0A5M6CUT0_9BACT|nr:YceI family protein [Adhaeribacter rhizoryzae]KAA5538951.1 YceI family protein [Adhaeribacter rhizoryzae]
MLLSKSILLLLILLSGFNRPINKPYFKKWVITNGSSLQVNGSTNINKFNCVIANYSRPDTLTFYHEDEAETIKFTGLMVLDVQNFDCHNPMMTKNLRKTLKTKIHPKLFIKFISLNRYPDENDHGREAIHGAVSIQLAGVTRFFNIHYNIISAGTNSLTMVGNRRLKFSAFNLSPPKKIGNMIQAKDELDIIFHLNVKVLD